MKNKRRDFLKLTGMAGLGIAGSMFKGLAVPADNPFKSNLMVSGNNPDDEKNLSAIVLMNILILLKRNLDYRIGNFPPLMKLLQKRPNPDFMGVSILWMQ